MKDFELLKRTYPISEFNRRCDGYDYIIKNSTIEERTLWCIDINKLQQTIVCGERYMYQVGKENGVFKAMCLSFANYAIIRKYLFNKDDD